jgi:hypothetical protein
MRRATLGAGTGHLPFSVESRNAARVSYVEMGQRKRGIGTWFGKICFEYDTEALPTGPALSRDLIDLPDR